MRIAIIPFFFCSVKESWTIYQQLANSLEKSIRCMDVPTKDPAHHHNCVDQCVLGQWKILEE
jgi:hypothetical protein